MRRGIVPWVSLAVAILALILSQLHPLYTYLDKPKLKADLHSNMLVTHYLGDLFFTPYVKITNVGRASGTVTRIELLVEKRDNPAFRKRMPAQTYFLKPEALGAGQIPTRVPFGQISIASSASWESYVEFFVTPTAAKRIKADEFQKRIHSEFGVFNPFGSSRPTISKELYQEITRLSEDELRTFDIGEYYLLALFWTDDKKDPAIRRGYTFTVFDGHLARLRAVTEGYRFGEMLVRPPLGPPGFNTDLSAIDDAKTIEKLTRDFSSM